MTGSALALLLLVASPGEDAARETRRVTLEEVIDLGLAYSLGLESARLAALRERLRVDEADAAWDPVVTADAGGSETLLPSRSSLAGANVVDTDNFNFALGVVKPFRLGPSLGVDWRADRTFTNSSFSTINPAYDTALEISLTVPLLQGRGRSAQESDLRATRAGAEAARATQRDEAEALVADIADAFWTLVAAQDRIVVLEGSLQLAREIEQTERRKLSPEIGRSTPLDVTKAHAETKRREAVLIEGRLDADNASDELRRLVLPFTGRPSDRIALVAVGRPGDRTDVPGLDGLVERALARRPDLQRTDHELARLHEAVVRARDALRFQLDLTAGVTWRGVSGDLDESASDTLTGKTPSVSAGLRFVWPLGRRAARAALRRAELDLERARIDRREQVNTILVEVRRAHRRLRTALREIEATREEAAAARSALEGERRRLARGSTTVLEVARLEESLTQAELRLLEARTDAEKARVRIGRVTGMLLDGRGLAFGPRGRLARTPG